MKGHGRLEALKLLGWENAPVDFQDYESELEEFNDRIADNEISRYAEFDRAGFLNDIEGIPDIDFEEFGLLDFELPEIEKYPDGESGSMVKNYGASPFSVLDTRTSNWLGRRKIWNFLESNKGRSESLLGESEMINQIGGGTSIFDPVLCEIIISWFSKKDDIILDPFAGGSVRGIVSAKLGRQYIGNDLRPEQVEENRKQATQHCLEIMPTWTVGDSLEIGKLTGSAQADFLFSCPPYADLEKYSKDAKDLSNMNYVDFKKTYSEIIKKSCELLKEDSFACFVVGEVRSKDKNGAYYNFVGDTITAFIESGLSYYNEIVLINSAGTLPLRAGKAMRASRKVGKMHQNILVFLKGNAKKAAIKCGDITILEGDQSDQEEH